MKLNKLILPAVAVASLFATTGCNDDYLEKYPTTSLTEQNAFQTYDNFKAFAYNLYGLFTNTTIWTNHTNTYYYATQWTSDFNSGLMTNRENSYNPYAWQNITPTLESDNWNFSPVRTANIMLSHIDEGNDLNDAEKRHWRAVGYFFHAWWSMELVNKYGDVPWINSVLTDTSEEAYGPRMPRAEVADSIVARLEYAIANIGDTSADGDNCVTADACRAALSRFLLREAHGLSITTRAPTPQNISTSVSPCRRN